MDVNQPGLLSNDVRIKVGGRTRDFGPTSPTFSTSIPLGQGQRIPVYSVAGYAKQSLSAPGPPKNEEPDEPILLVHPDGSYAVVGVDVGRKSPDEQLPPHGDVDTSTDLESSSLSATARRGANGVWFLSGSG